MKKEDKNFLQSVTEALDSRRKQNVLLALPIDEIEVSVVLTKREFQHSVNRQRIHKVIWDEVIEYFNTGKKYEVIVGEDEITIITIKPSGTSIFFSTEDLFKSLMNEPKI